MRITGNTTDDAVMQELGARISRLRIDRGLTQEKLARESGIGLASLVRLENGDNSRMSTVIRVLRQLGRLDAMDMLLPPDDVRPMDLLRAAGKKRKRASSVSEKPAVWKWGDES